MVIKNIHAKRMEVFNVFTPYPPISSHHALPLFPLGLAYFTPKPPFVEVTTE